MFFIGQLDGTQTMPNLQTDLIGLLTGAITDPAQLGAGWNKPACRIVSTVAPGWRLADASAGSVTNTVTPKVIAAAYTDDPTKEKFVRISGDGGANGLTWDGYEAWNAATNVGTNRIYPLAVTNLHWPYQLLSGARWIVLSASQAHIAFLNYNGAAMGGLFTCSNIFVSEFSRDDPWNTVENGYPSWFMAGVHPTATNSYNNSSANYAGIGVPRFLNGYSAADQTPLFENGATTASTSGMRILPAVNYGTVHVSTNINGRGLESVGYLIPNASVLNANKELCTGIYPLRFCATGGTATGTIPVMSSNSVIGGSITAKAPFIYGIANMSWQPGDQVVIDGETYMYQLMCTANSTTPSVGTSSPLLIKEA